MKKFIVTQCFRCSLTPKITEDTKSKIVPYKFTPDINPGTYTEQEFLGLLGKDFLQTENYKEIIENGWVKVIEEKDITSKSLKAFNKL